ncbi:MAG TPA: alpha/beta hydrolase [Fodinibius sp.]|nr:alpha/beta hydrolase [Fodinibius sp.]
MLKFLSPFILVVLFWTPFTNSQAIAQATDSQWFKVERTGEGPPMLLIPGLSSSGEVWNTTINHFQNQFECHAFTLAGFAGVPPVESDKFLPVVKDQLIQYMEENLNQPAIIIGHSLGGFLGYWIGSERPDLLKAAVIIDSAPSLAGLQFAQMAPKTRKQIINQMITGMENQTKEQFEASQSRIFASMIQDPDTAKTYSKWGKASDRNTVIQAMKELYTTDLSDQLSAMQVPTLHLYSWAPYAKYGATKESVLTILKKQTRLHPNITFSTHDTAWHFMMTDEPKWFFGEVEAFLKPILQQ